MFEENIVTIEWKMHGLWSSRYMTLEVGQWKLGVRLWKKHCQIWQLHNKDSVDC